MTSFMVDNTLAGTGKTSDVEKVSLVHANNLNTEDTFCDF